jgi:hypothetical protein
MNICEGGLARAVLHTAIVHNAVLHTVIVNNAVLQAASVHNAGNMQPTFL